MGRLRVWKNPALIQTRGGLGEAISFIAQSGLMAQPYSKVELKRFPKAHTVDNSESYFWRKFRVRVKLNEF